MYLLICNDVHYDIKILHFVDILKIKKCKYLENQMKFFLEINSKIKFCHFGALSSQKNIFVVVTFKESFLLFLSIKLGV